MPSMLLELRSDKPDLSAKLRSAKPRQTGLNRGFVRCVAVRPAQQKFKPVLASLCRKVDGSMSPTEENPKTVQEHFTRVCDAASAIELIALEEIQKRPVREELAVVPTDEEIIAAFRKPKSCRSPGYSKIPTEFRKDLVSREDTFPLVREIVHMISGCNGGALKNFYWGG
jgi:hypothetical protein